MFGISDRRNDAREIATRGFTARAIFYGLRFQL
jgi:hypothetical protein